MKNTEKEYNAERIANTMETEKTNEDYNNRKPIITDPNETSGKPEKILPATSEETEKEDDKLKKTA